MLYIENGRRRAALTETLDGVEVIITERKRWVSKVVWRGVLPVAFHVALDRVHEIVHSPESPI